MLGVPLVLAAPPAVAWLAASETGSGTDPWSVLASAGVAGAIAVLFTLGWLHPKSTVEALRADLAHKDELIAEKDAQLSAAATALVDRVIPAVTDATRAVENVTPLLRIRGAGDAP